jgi:hypothetical protein
MKILKSDIMRQITQTIFHFDELKPEVQKKVIDKYRENNQYDGLSDEINERCKELLEENKIQILSKFKVYYSLGFNQGDGAMFEGYFTWDKYNVSIKQSGHYYHYNSKSYELELLELIDDYFENEEETNKAIIQLHKDEEYFNELYVSICRKMEKYGYDYIEYEDSEDYIKENIISNEYEYFEDGNML